MLVMENTRNGLVVVESGDRNPIEVRREIRLRDKIQCMVDDMEKWDISIADLKAELGRRNNG